MLAIKTENLSRRFGAFSAVEALDLEVHRGDVFGFLGPNGSGKTTVMKMLTGLMPLSGGDAWVEGLNVRTQGDELRRKIGYMSQKFSLYEDLTVAENLQFYGRIYGLPRVEMNRRIDEVIALNHLEPYINRPSGKLSGGWKQRLALGCAMLHQPSIVFLDEPTAGIDPVARRELWDLLFEFSGRGVTFFVTTHYMDEAERCNRLAYIYNSRLLAGGSPAELRALEKVNPKGTRRLEIVCSETTRALQHVRKLPGVLAATVFGQAIHAVLDSGAPDESLRGPLAALGIVVEEIRAIGASLEDVFVQLTLLRRQELEAAHV
jgi:ABC-type multidrug transport system ATPase subunit